MCLCWAHFALPPLRVQANPTMLKTRIITAIIILLIVLLALFAFPSWAWGIFTLGIAAAACWEWGGFCAFNNNGKRLYFALTASFLAAIFFTYWYSQFIMQVALYSFIVSAVFWFILAPLWLARAARSKSGVIMAITGWVVILPMWLALLTLHDKSPWMLLTFAAIVWVADVFAYFVGRALGKHKLASEISPGKTVEGTVGGMVGVALYFFIWQHFSANVNWRGMAWAFELREDGLWLLGFFILLGLLSVLGDLFESWMKRGVGLKDSSHLLPGHGGLLDRIDALTATLPIAGLYVMLVAYK